jgi:hypothetical protein
MPTIKSILFWAVLICLTVVVEVVREMTGIPVCIGDLLFIPLALFMLYFVLQPCMFMSNRVDDGMTTAAHLKKNGWVFIVALGITALGLFCIRMGFNNPWEFFTGVKGAAHGYTLFLVGLSIATFGAHIFIGLIVTAFKIPRE